MMLRSLIVAVTIQIARAMLRSSLVAGIMEVVHRGLSFFFMARKSAQSIPAEALICPVSCWIMTWKRRVVYNRIQTTEPPKKMESLEEVLEVLDV